MSEDVRTVWSTYKVEQRKPAGKMHTTFATKPWQVVSADLVGPLPKSNFDWKSNQVIVFTDTFTKWAEFAALRLGTSRTILKALKDRIICRFNYPELLIMDTGSNFPANSSISIRKRYNTTIYPSISYACSM